MKFGGGFGNMGNMQAMMKQAQKMQEQLKQAQQELDEAEVEGTSGGGLVTVTLNGKSKLLAIKLDPKAVDPDDVEMLEDLIIAAFNDADERAQELYEEKLGPLSSLM